MTCTSGAIPWNAFCGKGYVDAGAEGCSTCTDFRDICATTCNWCSDTSVTTTTATTTTTTTTTTVNTSRKDPCFINFILSQIYISDIHVILRFKYLSLECDSGYYQDNDRSICSAWFDYDTPCSDDSSCDSGYRMPLTSSAKTWLSSQGLSQTTSAMCGTSAPWPLSRTTPLLTVKYLCQQICDYCLPSTTTSTSTTTTTSTNRRN